MRRPRHRTVPPRLQRLAVSRERVPRSGQPSPKSAVARHSGPSVASSLSSATVRAVRRRWRLKMAETPASTRPAPGRPPEAGPAPHVPLVMRRGRVQILATPGAQLAVVYVRQASLQQVLEPRASTARQDALRDDAVALGWPATRVVMIDADQGQSGAAAQPRRGCQRRRAEVTRKHGGLVLGVAMSRLARRSQDWPQWLDVCALFGTRLADQDGVDDANDPHDRRL
jgi:Resolvase, N terminal domain